MTTSQNSTKEILVLSSYPARECGIATYSKDLIDALTDRLSNSFTMSVCALEKGLTNHIYPQEVKYILDSENKYEYRLLAEKINADDSISAVLIEHEFGLFGGDYGSFLLILMRALKKPVIVTFHTVLPQPEAKRARIVKRIVKRAKLVTVMTNHSAQILQEEYAVPANKINCIPHGTHAIEHIEKIALREKYGFEGRTIISTFGLISSNKNIETALDALPIVVEEHPDLLYLIIGKTHPEVLKNEGESYRESLVTKVAKLGLQKNVFFINKYLELSELLDLLQMTDTYLFTSKDRNQAVSGTFAYALSCGCPVIATAIPHAKELLSYDTGILIDFENPKQLSSAILTLLNDDSLREQMSKNGLHKSKISEWKNTAISYGLLFQPYISIDKLEYNLPELSLKHIKRLTHNFGILQFSKMNIPDYSSGYTLDDNARALIAICMDYDIRRDVRIFNMIDNYLRFIGSCQQENGQFINYIDEDGNKHPRNENENLEDSNGRAIWALGTVISHQKILPKSIVAKAELYMSFALPSIKDVSSPRAIAFCIKGLYLYNTIQNSRRIDDLILKLGSVLVEKYADVKEKDWEWFENSMTYSNSILPESLIYVYLSSKKMIFKIVAKSTFDFLLSHIIIDGQIKVISNDGWLKKGKVRNMLGGEQPIDVAYTIQTLQLFSEIFKEQKYRENMEDAFDWFLGNNHLRQMIYNTQTGGCYDGLEKNTINLNQGAESTICYLMARLSMEKLRRGIPVLQESSVKRRQFAYYPYEQNNYQI
jgi:glycosyltransferase involved in cell wall biosynthesis